MRSKSAVSRPRVNRSVLWPLFGLDIEGQRGDGKPGNARAAAGDEPLRAAGSHRSNQTFLRSHVAFLDDPGAKVLENRSRSRVSSVHP